MLYSSFLTQLSTESSTPTLTNPYELNVNSWNSKRLHNLQRYFEQMATVKPKLLLVGEAPGYRGCRLTGVPFVSAHLLEAGLPNGELFGDSAGYESIKEWSNVRKEASSTIMWQTLTQLPALPLLWNACPFHPHKLDTPQSNRAPKTSEWDGGRPYIIQLLKLFPIQKLVAIGNKADVALTRWGLAHKKVRHPSHGGKRPFQSQLFKLVENI